MFGEDAVIGVFLIINGMWLQPAVSGNPYPGAIIKIQAINVFSKELIKLCVRVERGITGRGVWVRINLAAVRQQRHSRVDLLRVSGFVMVTGWKFRE